MKSTLCLLVGLALASSVAYADEKKAGELTDPVEILKKVDAAAKAVKSVRYDVTYEADGAGASRMSKLQGSVVESGFSRGAPEKYLIDVDVTMAGSSEPRKISGGTDNDLFFVVDHASKKAYEDIDPAVMGSAGRALRAAMMTEFVADAPFTDEINGKSQELKGSKTVGGEECYEIHVVYASERAPQATWYFSKRDFLPRRRIDHYTQGDNQTGTATRTITNLVVDPKIDGNAFKLKLPEGYTKTDEFAPDFLAP